MRGHFTAARQDGQGETEKQSGRHYHCGGLPPAGHCKNEAQAFID